MTSISSILGLLEGMLAVVATVVGFRARPARPSRVGLASAILPGLLMLVLFYSLAFHMYQSLGGWPKSIGENGFPPALITHCSIATNYFTGFVLVGIFVWPAVVLVCLAVPRWRVSVYYLVVYGVASLLALGLILLGPRPFLTWWWD